MLQPAAVSPASDRLAYVFDDDLQVAVLTSRMLSASGFRSQHFQSTAPFLTAVRITPPAVVLLDLALGRTDAVEVLRQLGVVEYAGSVLLISGRDRELLEAVQKIGLAQGLAMLPPLRKPFRLPELQEALHSEPRRMAPSTAPAMVPRVELEDALERKWLELWYQPKINLATNNLCGAEALVRVRHPRFGVVAPAGFLPGPADPLHVQLFQFVITQAVRDWFSLAKIGARLRLSINAPASLLFSGQLTSLIRQTVPERGGFPGLIVEITEEDVIREPAAARELATQLRLYNTVLSMDDFGAGATSISRLRDLPLHELKLDRSFVSGCSQNERNRLVCETTVKIGHQFNVSVCAEGVENSADLATIRQLGFDTAQGFLFAKPLRLPDLVKRILDRVAKDHMPGQVVSNRAWAA